MTDRFDGPPLFMTFEGIEGSGKTTQIERLALILEKSGRQVVLTREPGGCLVADAIRSVLLDPKYAGMVPRAELFLYAAARAQHVEEVIRPALDAGRWVLCDRFADATLAYQGSGRGLDGNLVGRVNQLAAGDLVPDLTLLLDLPAETGLFRARERNAQRSGPPDDRFEREALEFHRRVRNGYLTLARENPRFRLIDARPEPDRVGEQILQSVEEFVSDRCNS